MARAKRYYLPGHVWHITHRCHKREFLLKFARDRRRWIEWLYQAKKRYRGLSVLNYMVTSNHVHLLVSDRDGRRVIPDSIKLIAGRTGQEYNIRKNRKGAFWEDRYHATAVDSNRYLKQCMTYIDLNMVRAGVVEHPSAWPFCAYHEIQSPRKRKGIIDIDCLIGLLGFDDHAGLKAEHEKWIANTLQEEALAREKQWTKSIAVGSKSFIEKIKESLGFKARGRKIICSEDTFELREKQSSFSTPSEEEGANTFDWENNPLYS